MRTPFRFGRRARPTDDGLVRRVADLVAEVFSLPPAFRPVGADAQLYGQGFGVDSLDALQLVAALEEEFDVTIPDGELTRSNFESVRSIASLVERLERTR